MTPQRPRLLIIDDEPEFLEAISTGLSKTFDTTPLSSTASFEQTLASVRPDAILCDVTMTPIDGFALRRSILGTSFGRVPFLFVTGRTSERDRIAGLELGADDYVIKPISLPELVLRIHAVLRRRSLGYTWGDDNGEGLLHRLRHEVKTPMVAAGLGLQSILQFEGLPSQYRAIAQDSRDCLQSLGRILDDLLFLVALDQGTIRVSRVMMDATDSLRSALETISATWQSRGHRVVADIPPEAVAAIPVPGFERICVHLVDNAFKFSPPGSSIHIALTAQDGGGFSLSVHNSGTTILPEAMPHLFERFYQQDRSMTREHPGLGLGLHICSALAERSGGTLTPSVDATGVRMTLSYPRLNDR